MKFPFSAASALTIFFAVLICGTFWRLMSLHLAASSAPGAQTLGQAMAFQY
jgi:hypothetical protein